MRTRQGLAGTTVLCAVAATLLAGCGGGGRAADAGGSASDVAAPSTAAQGELDAVSGTADAGRASGSAGSGGGSTGRTGPNVSGRVLPPGRDVVYRGEITVRVKDIGQAVTRVESLVGSSDGLVFAEQSTTDPGQRAASSASMTLRVPPTQFRPVLDRLGRLGTPLSRSQTAEDVTTQVIDLESRLSSQSRSVARIRALLDEASTIGQIVQVEGELARREADLESLQAQQKKLKDVTDLASIELSLVTRATQPPARDEDSGFVAGLRAGWDALASVVVAALTVAGAVLPFVITLALVGVPVWLVLRSRRRAPTTTPAPTTAP
jgi:hypothetical protein